LALSGKQPVQVERLREAGHCSASGAAPSAAKRAGWAAGPSPWQSRALAWQLCCTQAPLPMLLPLSCPAGVCWGPGHGGRLPRPCPVPTSALEQLLSHEPCTQHRAPSVARWLDDVTPRIWLFSPPGYCSCIFICGI